MSWGEVEKINSWAKKGVPLNHLIWLNDYKTFGEDSYVFQNKDILHELYKDPSCITDLEIRREALEYVCSNCSQAEAESILGKYLFADLDNLLTNGVPFADATDDELNLLLLWHYHYGLDLTKFWSVGDKRSAALSAMTATGVSESHVAQTVEFAIADFDHDTLTHAVNGNTKAAVTLAQVGILNENGYMNSGNTNAGGWTSCMRRTWCNNVYYNALPASFRNIVRPVNKLTSAGNTSAVINTTSDKVWLLSEIEIFGSTIYSKDGEGTQYAYYANADNRKKSNYWWERSPYGSADRTFCAVTMNGDAHTYSAGNFTVVTSYGLVTGLCI